MRSLVGDSAIPPNSDLCECLAITLKPLLLLIVQAM